MPVLTNNPEINKALVAAGLTKAADDSEIDLYEKHELSDEDVIMKLSSMASGAGSEALRLRALELAMKAKKMLTNDLGVSSTNINIIIQDPNGPKGINPILIPREVQI